MDPWLILIVIYAAVFISSPLITIFHELGHAFAYLLLTKPDKIDIFIGSYGNTKESINLKLGKLHFYIKKSFPFVKGIGMCSSNKPETNYFNNIIILLAGTVFTLIAATIISIIAFSSNAHILVQVSCYIFLGFSFFSLLTNLVPHEIKSTTGMGLESDGNQILFNIQVKTALADYIEACKHLHEKDFENGTMYLKNVLVHAPHERKILRLLIYALIQQKQYDDAALYIARLEHIGELLPNDMLNKGCVQSFKNEHDEAIITYQYLLKKDRKNLQALNNIAYELIEKGAYIVAQRALDKALKIDVDFYYANNTMAYSKILQDEFDEAKSLIDKCFKLDPEQAFTYKTLGIYYLKLRDIPKATANFHKAVELDNGIDLGVYAAELKQLTETWILT